MDAHKTVDKSIAAKEADMKAKADAKAKTDVADKAAEARPGDAAMSTAPK